MDARGVVNANVMQSRSAQVPERVLVAWTRSAWPLIYSPAVFDGARR